MTLPFNYLHIPIGELSPALTSLFVWWTEDEFPQTRCQILDNRTIAITVLGYNSRRARFLENILNEAVNGLRQIQRTEETQIIGNFQWDSSALQRLEINEETSNLLFNGSRD